MNKREVYRSIIMDNYKKPNKFVKSDPDGYEKQQTDTNSCVDDFIISIKFKDKKINDVVFSGSGCAISTSSINILANYLISKNKKKASSFLENYKKMIKGGCFNKSDIKDLIAFEGVYKHLNRIPCALIGVNAILKILEHYEGN